MKYLVVLCALSLSVPAGAALAAAPVPSVPSGANRGGVPAQPAGAYPRSLKAATIRAGEMIDVQVSGEPGLSKSYVADASGRIAVDLIGQVSVAGRTPDQVAAELRSRLGRVLKRPTVAVTQSTPVRQEVMVMVTGDAQRPGSVKLRPGDGVLDALAAVGGLSPSADSARVTLARKGQPQPQTLNIEALLKGDLSQNVPLVDGDILQVPRKEVPTLQIMGEVRQPGVRAMNGTPTVLDAIMSAGGLTERADRGRVTLTRKGQPQPISIDLDQVLAGDTGANQTLQPGDVLQVASRVPVGVAGEVRSAGERLVRSGGTLMEAILLAGGFGPEADRAAIQVTHRDGTTDRFSLEGVDTVVGGPELRLGDLVIVPRVKLQTVTVSGAVRTPGVMRYQKEMRLPDLLMAVGVLETANSKQIRLLRGEGAKRQVIAFNLEAYLKQPQAESPALQPGDQIFVEARKIKAGGGLLQKVFQFMPLAGLLLRP